MERYLIYQLEDKTLKRRVIKDLEAAQKIVDLDKPVKLDGVKVHIVGIGNDADYRKHLEILGNTRGPAFKNLQNNIAYYKQHGKWPE